MTVAQAQGESRHSDGPERLTAREFVVHCVAVDENSEALPLHRRWNFVAFVTDLIFFRVSFAFFNIASVLPAFVGQLTDSAPIVGLVGTAFRGGWLLPQLVTAHLIKEKPHKKPYMLIALAGRVTLWVIAAALWAGLAGHPAATLILFFVCLGLFAAADGIASLAWFDIIARAIPLRERGRLMGTGQFVGGLAGIGVGALVGLILEHRPFPGNYALLFALAGVALIPSTIALAFVREPAPMDDSHQNGNQAKRSWIEPLVSDPTFRRLMICRSLFGMLGLATPFYVLHAGDVLRLPQSIIGRFVIAETLAGVVSSPALGLVSQRWGPRYVIRIGIAAAAAGPLFALAAHLSRSRWLIQGYPFVFVALGIVNSTFMLGFSNYTLEIAPEAMRSAYIGLAHTIAGVMALAPSMGGWLLEATSYTTLFSLTVLIAAASLLLSSGLKPVLARTHGQDQL